MGKVAILGAGRWGSALGLVLSRKGNEVMLFDRNPSVVEALKEGKDPYWGIGFEKKPLATTHLEEVLEFSQCILIALPVQVIRKVLEGKDLREKVFISASKGLEVGTLVLTSTSSKSRNRTFGFLLGQGLSLEQAQEKIGQVVEGKETVKAVKELSEKLNLYAPISWAVYRVVVEGEEPLKVARELLLRPPQRDFEGL
jgi:glycerol-3-phosphate dehydrogenase